MRVIANLRDGYINELPQKWTLISTIECSTKLGSVNVISFRVCCFHFLGPVEVMGTTRIKGTHTELAFTATHSVSGQCCEVKQQRARLVAGWVTLALEQGRQGILKLHILTASIFSR